MQHANYRAWELNPVDFLAQKTPEQQALFLLRYALLAPSSHNTQPWRFRICEQGQEIELLPDFARSLPCSDPHFRQFYLSLGCALGNLLVAATSFGFEPLVSYSFDEAGDEASVRVRLQQAKAMPSLTSLAHAALLPWITRRRINRAPYDASRPVPLEIVDSLQRVNDEDTVTLSLINNDGHPLFRQFLELVWQSTLVTQSNAGIIEEWSRWFRPLDTQESDGVPPFDFLVPETVTTVAEQAERITALFATAPMFLALSTVRDDPEQWVRTGKVLAWLSLTAEKWGLSQAPWGAVVEDKASAQRASQLLGGKQRLLFFARLGYASTIPHHSPRRPVEEVVQYV